VRRDAKTGENVIPPRVGPAILVGVRAPPVNSRSPTARPDEVALRRQRRLERLVSRGEAPDAAAGDETTSRHPSGRERTPSDALRDETCRSAPGAVRRDDHLGPGRARLRDRGAVGAGEAGADGEGVHVRPGRASAAATSDGGRGRRGPAGRRRHPQRSERDRQPRT
jgi:hypothetical protein